MVTIFEVTILVSCGECSGIVEIPVAQTSGKAPCDCGGWADVAWHYSHVPWCPLCGVDKGDCLHVA